MTWYWVVGITALGALLFWFSTTETGRFVKTIFLIARVSPYEQAGTGAGRILVIGDSTGYGTGARRGADSVAGRMGADFPDYQIINASKNNDSLADAYERMSDTMTGQYDLILLQLGANDVIQQHDMSDITADVLKLYELLRPHTPHIVMVSAGNVGAAFAFEGQRAAELTELSRVYHAALAEFAEARADFTYVSLFDEPENDPFVAEPQVYLTMDGLHPSGAGYGLWYQKLAPVLATKLENTPVPVSE